MLLANKVEMARAAGQLLEVLKASNLISEEYPEWRSAREMAWLKQLRIIRDEPVS